MKKINFLASLFLFLIFFNILKADSNISIREYIKSKKIEEGTTQIYILNRCSAVYAYASAVTLKTDSVNSKKFIEIANSLLFKSVELSIIDDKKKFESAKKKAEKVREDLFKKYVKDGKKNWDKNKSHFKESYIFDDITICKKLVSDK
jgi:hypothetical protein